MTLLLITLIILIPQIGYSSTSDLAPEQYYAGSGVVPEIEIMATRLIHEPMDSIGPMPGIIVYGEKPDMNARFLIERTKTRNRFFVDLSDTIGRYALFTIAALFMVSLGIVAISKVHHIAHIHQHPPRSSAVHKYYLQHKNETEREMQRYLANLIGNSK